MAGRRIVSPSPGRSRLALIVVAVMVLTCPSCARSNPGDALFCHHDGSWLGQGGEPDGSADPSRQFFRRPFVFPSGRACLTFDDLALACLDEWPTALELLHGGDLARFFAALDRADLVRAAVEAARYPDPDLALDRLLSHLPARTVSLPQLRVEPALFDLGTLSADQDARLKLHLSNVGMGLLHGAVVSEGWPWLALGEDAGSASKLFRCHRDLVIPVTVRGRHLRASLEPLQGLLVVTSNAGSAIVVIRARIEPQGFVEGVLAGAQTPRQLAEKAKAAPKEAARLFESGAVARWYAANGWTYPVAGPSASGVAAVQQFFEALGLTTPPRVEISVQSLALRGRPGEALQASLRVSTQERRPVYAHAHSDQPWLDVQGVELEGRSACIRLAVAAVPACAGQTLQARLSVTANGRRRFLVPVSLSVEEAAVPAPSLSWLFGPGGAAPAAEPEPQQPAENTAETAEPAWFVQAAAAREQQTVPAEPPAPAPVLPPPVPTPPSSPDAPPAEAPAERSGAAEDQVPAGSAAPQPRPALKGRFSRQWLLVPAALLGLVLLLGLLCAAVSLLGSSSEAQPEPEPVARKEVAPAKPAKAAPGKEKKTPRPASAGPSGKREPSATVPVRDDLSEPPAGFVAGARLPPPRLYVPIFEKRDVEVVFCLDTTGSMGGLLDGAKQKVWAICNQIAGGKPTPDLKVGLVAYRDKGDEYITKVFNLTTDLDAVNANLKTFVAAGGGDFPESVNQALFDAVNKITWSKDKKTLRIIFLVGDAPPHMDYHDDVKYPITCKEAVSRGILINCLQCGNDPQCRKFWLDISSLAGGAYAQIPQAGGVVAALSPFDRRLSAINGELVGSVLLYGPAWKRARDARRLAEARGLSEAKAADRAGFAAKSKRMAAFDLLDALNDKRVKLEDLKDDELPDELKKLPTLRARKEYLAGVEARRKALYREAVELDGKRAEHIARDLAKRGKGKDSFDAQVLQMLRKQAKKCEIAY
jgi:hypothetical protein